MIRYTIDAATEIQLKWDSNPDLSSTSQFVADMGVNAYQGTTSVTIKYDTKDNRFGRRLAGTPGTWLVYAIWQLSMLYVSSVNANQYNSRPKSPVIPTKSNIHSTTLCACTTKCAAICWLTTPIATNNGFTTNMTTKTPHQTTAYVATTDWVGGHKKLVETAYTGMTSESIFHGFTRSEKASH